MLFRSSDKIVGIVFVSNETKCHVDQVGRLASEEQIQAVAEEFALRNPQPGAPEASPMQRVPISSIQPGVVDAGWRDAIPVSQPENELLLRYQARLGRELTAGPVQHPQSTTWLRIDAYDDQTDTLIEAKSSARRTHVLQAIAQLHDYGRLIPDHKRKLVLLPAAPEVDLFDLAHSLDVDICYEDGSVFRTDPQGGPR